MEELVRALKGERRGPPRRTGELKLPPGTGFRAEGKIPVRLRIGGGEAVLSGDAFGEVREPIAGVDGRLRDPLWEQQRALHPTGIGTPHRTSVLQESPAPRSECEGQQILTASANFCQSEQRKNRCTR